MIINIFYILVLFSKYVFLSNYPIKLDFLLVLLVLVKMTVATIYWAPAASDHPEDFEAFLLECRAS